MRIEIYKHMLSLLLSLIARCKLSSFLPFYVDAFTSMFYRGSLINISLSRVLAMNNFFAAFRTKLCSENGKIMKPNKIIITFVIPPNLPRRSKKPKTTLLCFTIYGYS
jgi:hypothetical protein